MGQQPSDDRLPGPDDWSRASDRSDADDADDELLLIPLWRRRGASQAELIRLVWSTGAYSVEVLGPETADQLRELFARLRPSGTPPADRPLPAIGAFDFSDLPDDVSERVEDLVYGEEQ